MTELESTRVDRWLWSVRAFHSRTDATEACRGGHVRVNAMPAKPATAVRAGDVVTLRSPGHERVLEVLRVIERRVGAAVAAECVLDRTPPPPVKPAGTAGSAPAGLRPRGSGRPTKRDRRQLEHLRDRHGS